MTTYGATYGAILSYTWYTLLLLYVQKFLKGICDHYVAVLFLFYCCVTALYQSAKVEDESVPGELVPFSLTRFYLNNDRQSFQIWTLKFIFYIFQIANST